MISIKRLIVTAWRQFPISIWTLGPLLSKNFKVDNILHKNTKNSQTIPARENKTIGQGFELKCTLVVFMLCISKPHSSLENKMREIANCKRAASIPEGISFILNKNSKKKKGTVSARQSMDIQRTRKTRILLKYWNTPTLIVFGDEHGKSDENGIRLFSVFAKEWCIGYYNIIVDWPH